MLVKGSQSTAGLAEAGETGIAEGSLHCRWVSSCAPWIQQCHPQTRGVSLTAWLITRAWEGSPLSST